MRREIPSDPGQYQKLVSTVSLRMQASEDWYHRRRDRWRECYERWDAFPARPEEVAEDDPYEIKLGYAFGVLEQICSKITEPLLQMGVPFAVHPTELGDQRKADNFTSICADFYSKPHVQAGKRKSKKEMCITGQRFEVDEWLHVVVPGMAWGQEDRIVETPIRDAAGQPKVGPDGRPLVAVSKTQVVAEVPRDIVTHYGFNTRYPSVFDIYPEPNRTTIDTGQKTDVSWYVEDLGELALEDLMREVIYDPAQKKTVPRYDFSKLLADAGEWAQKRYAEVQNGQGNLAPDPYGPLITPVHDWAADTSNKGVADKRRANDAVALQSFEDRDKVWVAQMRTPTMILTVAQGKYIIECVYDPWHRPRLGLRIENYTIDPRSLYGVGALDPILGELAELDITHSLGMQNLFRLVNKMIAVKEKALVSMDDLDARSGGVVRVNDEVATAAEAVFPIQTPSAINEMMAGESNIKGTMEFITSNLDAAPGIMGTKANNRTKSGFDQAVVNLAGRFGTMQSQGLINEALCGESMEYMFAQFAFEPMPYKTLRDDGATVYAKFTRNDIDTEGRGFRYLVTVDPVWGNTQAQRQDALDLLKLFMDYEKWRLEAKDPKAKKAVVSKAFEDVLKKFGRRDLTGFFVSPDGEVSPEQELAVLMQGGVVEACKGDKEHHITTHILQKQSPALQEAVQAGKAAPDTVQNLDRLIRQAGQALTAFLQDPRAAAAEKLQQAGLAHPDRPGGQA